MHAPSHERAHPPTRRAPMFARTGTQVGRSTQRHSLQRAYRTRRGRVRLAPTHRRKTASTSMVSIPSMLTTTQQRQQVSLSFVCAHAHTHVLAYCPKFSSHCTNEFLLVRSLRATARAGGGRSTTRSTAGDGLLSRWRVFDWLFQRSREQLAVLTARHTCHSQLPIGVAWVRCARRSAASVA